MQSSKKEYTKRGKDNLKNALKTRRYVTYSKNIHVHMYSFMSFQMYKAFVPVHKSSKVQCTQVKCPFLLTF